MTTGTRLTTLMAVAKNLERRMVGEKDLKRREHSKHHYTTNV